MIFCKFEVNLLKNISFMRKITLITGFLLFLLSCGENPENQSSLHGGTLNLNEPFKINQISPYNISNAGELRLVNAIHGFLFRYNLSTLEVEPYAIRYQQSDSTNKTFILILQSNVFFHPDACFGNALTRKMNSSDIKYSLELWISQKYTGKNCPESLLAIEGCKEFLNKKADNISGLTISNDSVFKIKCTKTNPLLIDQLCNMQVAIVPREAIEKYGNANTIGIGPFITDGKTSEKGYILLTRNSRYFLNDFQQNNLPYLDSVKIFMIGSVREELEMFKSGKLDLITGLNTRTINEFLDENINMFQSNPPQYILMQETGSDKNPVYILYHTHIKGITLDIYTNPDLSKIYLIDKPTEINKTDTLL